MDRKTFLGATGALIGGATIPFKQSFAGEPSEIIAFRKPAYLKKGDAIGVTAPAGWVVTTSASGSLSAQLTSAASVVNEPDIGLDLGATVTGQILNDLAGKGRINRQSPPLEGWRVFIDTNSDGAWQPNEPSVVTNSAGQFTLTGLRPGTYLLRVISETGWQQTKPKRNAPLRIHLAWKRKIKTQPFGEHLT